MKYRSQTIVNAAQEDLYTDPLDLIAIAGTSDNTFVESVTNRLVLFAVMTYDYRGSSTMITGHDVLTKFSLRQPLLNVAKTLNISIDERQMLLERCLESIRSSTFIIRPYRIARNNGRVREYAIRINKGDVVDSAWLS